MRRLTIGVALAATFVCCGTDSGPGTPSTGDIPPGWDALVRGAWSVPSAAERYKCVRRTMPVDTYVSAFRAEAPLGTHHTVVTMGDPNGPDGVSDCNSFVNHDTMIYGSGIGTDETIFPPGVGIRIPAGQQILLNLHLFNASSQTITGTSGTLMKTVDVSEVVHVAEAQLMGKVSGLNVDTYMTTETGYCTLNGEANVFGVFPHMHELGVHMRVEGLPVAGGPTMMHDRAYDWEEQKIHMVDPIVTLQAGDRIAVHCTYDNDRGFAVGWGESSTDEMCFAGVFKYPANSNWFVCTN